MVNNNLYDDGFIVTYAEGDASLERIPLEIVHDLEDESHTVKEDEALTDIAQEHYKDSRKWYAIADANIDVLEDVFNLQPGQELIIPNANKIT